jgi:hypothetical protein
MARSHGAGEPLEQPPSPPEDLRPIPTCFSAAVQPAILCVQGVYKGCTTGVQGAAPCTPLVHPLYTPCTRGWKSCGPCRLDPWLLEGWLRRKPLIHRRLLLMGEGLWQRGSAGGMVRALFSQSDAGFYLGLPGMVQTPDNGNWLARSQASQRSLSPWPRRNLLRRGFIPNYCSNTR